MTYNSNRAVHPLFSPAITLLNRINYTKKFTLLWLVSLVAIAVVVYSLFVNLNRIIQPSQRQIEGVALIKPISRTVQLFQQLRGVSAALLSGNESFRNRRAAKEKEAARFFDEMEAELPASLSAGEDFQRIKINWTKLRKDGPEWTATENFAAHTRLIEQLQMFVVFVADKYSLTLDPELASFYLINTSLNELPRTLEHLGKIRAYGTSILSEKRINESRKIELRIMMAELDSSLKYLGASLEKTARHNPAVQSSLRATYRDIVSSVQQVTDIVTFDILTSHFSMAPESFLDIATATIDNSYAQMYDSLLPMAETLIKARINRAKQELLTTVGISLLVFVLVVYLSISIYYAIVGNIKSLARAASAFANGNLQIRIDLKTKDELSWVGDSFNEMADGFNAMLGAQKRAEELLAREGRKNETLLRAASDGILILDLEGSVVQANDAFCKMLGYSAEELSGMNAAQWNVEFSAAQIKANIAALGDAAMMIKTRYRRRDGSIIDIEVNIAKVDVDERQLVYCSSRDVTQRKQEERALAESREKLHAVIETALDAVVQMGADGSITGWNKQAERTFDWTAEQAVGRMLSETIIPPQYREAHVRGLERFLASGRGTVLNTRFETVGMRRGGHEFPVELSITAIHSVDKYEFNGFIRDITQQKEAEKLIWNQANFDTLTGLPNRHMFHDRMELEIKKALRTGLRMALLFIDLDKFKEVNDTIGHSMGDVLLAEAARRISGCARETDTVARLGGDEFTVILAEIENDGNVERVAESILQSLAEPFRLGDETAYISASIGITLYPLDATEMEDLLKNADQAMYVAKSKGHNRFEYFTQSMQQAAQARLRLTNELRGALADGQFRIYYQPIVDMKTGRINKAEALIRWQHPERGMVSPAQFIPLAEETGLIVEIGDWVFRESAQQVKRWRMIYDAEFQISVNVSPVQFCSTTSCAGKAWFNYLRELDLTGQAVVIEITEGLLLNEDSDATGKLLDFRDASIQVAIDDFGTGYSSLSYLKRFDIDYLKIDQSFVRNLATDSDDMALSEAIIVMAHKLGLKVIAEGVETESQRELLTQAGCDFGQGYWFSRPISGEAFEDLLKAGMRE